MRELEEETDFTAERLEWIGKFSLGPSSQAIVDVFFAKAVKAKSSFNPDEIVQVELVDFKSVLQKLLEGECFGAALAVAALLASAKRLLE